MLKGSVQQDSITVVNIYASNIGVLKYIKHIVMDINREIDSKTIIVGDLNLPTDTNG